MAPPPRFFVSIVKHQTHSTHLNISTIDRACNRSKAYFRIFGKVFLDVDVKPYCITSYVNELFSDNPHIFDNRSQHIADNRPLRLRQSPPTLVDCIYRQSPPIPYACTRRQPTLVMGTSQWGVWKYTSNGWLTPRKNISFLFF